MVQTVFATTFPATLFSWESLAEAAAPAPARSGSRRYQVWWGAVARATQNPLFRRYTVTRKTAYAMCRTSPCLQATEFGITTMCSVIPILALVVPGPPTLGPAPAEHHSGRRSWPAFRR